MTITAQIAPSITTDAFNMMIYLPSLLLILDMQEQHRKASFKQQYSMS